MADLLKEIRELRLEDAVKLQAKARAGDEESARRFVLYSAWSKIRRDGYIPADKKIHVFETFAQLVELHFRFYTPPPKEPTHGG